MRGDDGDRPNRSQGDGWDEPDPFDTDFGHDDDTPPSWFPGQHLPPHARAMGLTAAVPDGALLDFAGSLDGTKRLHRITAWVLLVVFGLPVVFAIMRVVIAFSPL